MGSSWELQRNWEITRYLVYYLVENFVPPELIPGKDVVDFSSGLGDLSVYIHQHNPNSLISTSPDDVDCPQVLQDLPGASFMPNLNAREIAAKLAPNSVDLFAARMVFQFPTSEADRIDVDGMLSQIAKVLRPGGRLVVCSHEYTQLDDRPENWNLPLDEYFHKVAAAESGGDAKRHEGLIELIREISIPPREGAHGQTGFGLKGLMAVDSFVRAGFQIEEAAEIEDFTFPVGITKDLQTRREYYQELAEKVFAIKRRHILSKEFADKYRRPQVLQNVLLELNALHTFVTIPIFRIQAKKPE
jgi:SAM-dependent methyltransferase